MIEDRWVARERPTVTNEIWTGVVVAARFRATGPAGRGCVRRSTRTILAQSFREWRMALLLHTGPNTDAVVQQVITAQVQSQVPTAVAVAYRCAGCGDVLRFNALSAACRCVDECYAEPGASNLSDVR
jgi:hypothetical protein